MLNKHIIQGLFFGLNSGVITTVGLISGLMQTKITRNSELINPNFLLLIT